MIRLHLGQDDLRRIRFAYSPLWETITSLRTLSGNSGANLHRPWREAVRSRLDAVDMVLLTAVVRPTGYLPDFLVPSPARRNIGFDTSLTQIAAAPLNEVAEQLTHLAGHPVAQAGPGRAERVAFIRALAADPEMALTRITHDLEGYWRAAVAPVWPRLHSLLRDDIAYRLDQLADGGVEELFRSLHPSVRYDSDTLLIHKYYDGDASPDGRGLLLIPCAFAWPDVMVLTAQPHTPTLSYSPRGLGRLWNQPVDRSHAALAAVIGRTRADLIQQLDLPMATSQLATQLEVSAPTLNVHLKALHAAGIVTPRRDGRYVLYSRTPLSDLLAAVR